VECHREPERGISGSRCGGDRRLRVAESGDLSDLCDVTLGPVDGETLAGKL
jgi:hypothetical protein